MYMDLISGNHKKMQDKPKGLWWEWKSSCQGSFFAGCASVPDPVLSFRKDPAAAEQAVLMLLKGHTPEMDTGRTGDGLPPASPGHEKEHAENSAVLYRKLAQILH